MRIEEGKFYRTRDGRKVGPYEPHHSLNGIAWVRDDHSSARYLDGRHSSPESRGEDKPGDLIAEWIDDGPVRTVTRKEIVKGNYGKIGVGFSDESVVHIGFDPFPDHFWTPFTAAELRAAAAVFTSLADALEDGK